MHKLTKNQQIVLDALQGGDHPMGAYDILNVDAVRDCGLTAPLTIYRALDKLIEHGLVHRIESLNAFMACSHGPHDEQNVFMICSDCKKTVEVGAGEMRKVVSSQAQKLGFKVKQIQIEVSGMCDKCDE